MEDTDSALIRNRKAKATAERHRSDRGQGLVEFALVLPVFLVIILATVDFGWALRNFVVATNAAREGARAGITGLDSLSIQNTVVAKSAGLLSTNNVTVTGANGSSGSDLTISVAYDNYFVTPLGGLIRLITANTITNPIHITAHAVMRME